MCVCVCVCVCACGIFIHTKMSQQVDRDVTFYVKQLSSPDSPEQMPRAAIISRTKLIHFNWSFADFQPAKNFQTTVGSTKVQPSLAATDSEL